MKQFYSILVNTAVANITTSFLWFALTFWIYLETRSVLATAIVGGSYMLLLAGASIFFGTYVDHHKKKSVMVASSIISLLAFMVAAFIYMAGGLDSGFELSSPMLWVFSSVILLGAVVEHMRNIALSTIVTIMVPKEKHANANGLVGTVQGIAFIITSALSGLSIGFLGMGWTLVIAVALTLAALVHLLGVSIPEKGIAHDPELENKKVDIKGSIAAIKVVPGLFALLFFSMFNNFIGGIYMALMDPYGLELFSVQTWGIIFAVAGTGFIAGGAAISKWGLGKNPIKTLLICVLVMGALGAVFTIREWWWLYVAGIYAYMCLIPAVEAAEQTVIQRVVPLKRQGRVFGFASALESSAMPLTAFAIGPIAEFLIIPYMRTTEGQAQWMWLLGTGEARGIALIFFFGGLIMIGVALLALSSKSYQLLSKKYAQS